MARSNNCLEATNNVIKKEQTFGNRLAIREFLNVAFKRLKDWSTERAPECVNFKHFFSEPPCSLQLQTQAYQWVKADTQVLSRSHNGLTHYYIQPHGHPKLKESDLGTYDKQHRNLSWRSFKTYAKSHVRLWFVEFVNESWGNAKCSCENFLKTNYVSTYPWNCNEIENFHCVPGS